MSTASDSDISNLRQELLNLDIADLDDAEYEIPAVEKTPTLESILNDDESSLISEDELSSYLSQELITGFEDGGETASVSSLGSRRDYNTAGGSHSPSSSQGTSTHSSGSSILRHVILKAVSSQLRSAGDRVNAGKPTVMAVTTMVSVGTSHGFILMFDSTQTLRWCYEGDQEQGAVSCLCLNVDCTRLLAGFARGLILMLDTTDGRVLRTMNDVHTPSTAVLHVKFTDHPSLAVCSDSGGSVFELSFKRTLGIRSYDCKCLFSGSRGEVVTIEPLLLHQLSSHPLHGAVLIAMATLSKVILVSIRPNTRLLLTHSVKASPASLPLLSWQFVIIQVADSSRVMDPVLAFARDSTIYFYQVSVESLGRIVCVSLQQLNLGYSLLSCHWLNARTLALLDTTEAFHLVDVRTREELETIDLSGIGLVYNSGHFKGLATGGNVSKALALAGERACYNTVQSFGNQMLFLGIRSFHVISIRTWAERVNHLLCQNRFPDALNLCMDFYEERGKAVLGLRGPRKLRQRLVKDKMLDILLSYVETTLDSSDSMFCHEAIPIIVNYCVQLDQRDVLFGRLWDGVQTSSSGGRQIYLKSLENSILDGKLTSLPPEIMQQLVSYLEKSGQWQSLEQCVLKVDVMCLDLEQVLILGKQHCLYNTLISVWNRAMSDYISPIHELVPLLKEYLDSGGTSSEKARSLGNQLLVYLSCCLSGRGYPNGDIPSGNIETVRQQVFKCLCSQHSINAADAEDCYPYLRILLQFDTREFLNALAIAFEDPQFSTQLRQRLVNILILVMVEGEGFLSTQVGWLFTFLASQLSRSSYCALRVEPKLFQRVVEFLTSPNQTTLHEERQDAFLELMSAGGLSNYSHDDLLRLARSAEFDGGPELASASEQERKAPDWPYGVGISLEKSSKVMQVLSPSLDQGYQVCAVLHERQGEHQQVLKCYLLDNYRKQQVFNYIQQSPHKEELQLGILENIDALVEIDAVETGRTICRHFSQLIHEIIPQLSELQLYKFLQGACEEGGLESSLMTRYFSLMCRFNPEQVLYFAVNNNNIIVDEAVEISKQYGLDETTAVFLERRGDFQGAFDLLLDKLQLAMNQGGPLENITHELVSLAQRGAANLDPRKSWLPLLQCLLKLNSHDLLKRVLHNTDLSLASELHLLLEHTNGTLGDLRSLIMGMFEKCRHEMAMLKSTSQLQYADIHCQLHHTLQEVNKGIPGPTVCTLCHTNFKTQLYLFRCGHGYHTGCMETPDHCLQCMKHDVSG